MNKEFEKIIEKLEEYKHENLVEHDYEQLQHCKDIGDCGMQDCVLCVFNKAIEIVKQEAGQYSTKNCSECSRRKFYQIGYAEGKKNGGWIPCSGCIDCKHKECENYGKV